MISITPIKTGVFNPPQDDLIRHIRHIRNVNLKLKEGDIIAISSKVVGIWEGRTLPIDSIEKDELVKREARLWLPRRNVFGRRVMHTITNGILIASAGIDESNGNGWYILYPDDPDKSAQRILKFFQKEFGLKKLGVILTDSRSTPLRRGVTGFALSYAGFYPLFDYRGKKDIFGRPFHFSQSNIPDALAAIAVLAMGEGNEQTPIVVISGTDYVSKHPPRRKKPHSTFDVSLRDDLFGPFLKSVKWRKGKGK